MSRAASDAFARSTSMTITGAVRPMRRASRPIADVPRNDGCLRSRPTSSSPSSTRGRNNPLHLQSRTRRSADAPATQPPTSPRFWPPLIAPRPPRPRTNQRRNRGVLAAEPSRQCFTPRRSRRASRARAQSSLPETSRSRRGSSKPSPALRAQITHLRPTLESSARREPRAESEEATASPPQHPTPKYSNPSFSSVPRM
jgi:hypothetical protein